MGWGNKFPDLKNDPSYLEGRLSNAEMSLAQNAQQQGNITQLNTTDKSSIVNALKEIKTQANVNAASINGIGNLKFIGVYATLSALQTAYPTGTTGIALVTVDGYGYYWNGSAWTQGAIFQATELDQSLKNTTINFMSIPTLVNRITNGNFVDTTGWSSSSSFNRASSLSASANTLSVTGTTNSQVGAQSGTGIFELNKKYYVKMKARVTNANCQLIQLKQGDIAIFGQVLNPVQNQWYTIDGILNVTSIAHTFLHFFHMYADAATANGKVMEVQYVDVIDLTTQYGSGLEPSIIDFRNTLSCFDNSWFEGTGSLFNVQKVLNTVKPIPDNFITPSSAKDYFKNKSTVFLNTNIDYTNGNAVNNQYFTATDFIQVDPSSTYVINRNDNKYSSTGNMAWYDDNKNYIGGQQSTYETFTLPSNARYIRFCVYNTTDLTGLTLQKGTAVMPVLEIPSFNNVYAPTRYNGKKWVGIGDSITETNQRAYLHYHDYIKQELGLNFVNMGVGGTGYKNRDNETPNVAFYQRALSCPTDADLITIFGGVNDVLFQSAPIGIATDTGTATWCGCVNTTIDNLQSLMPYVPLGIITPLPCCWVNPGNQSLYPVQNPNDLSNRMSQFVDQLIQICKLRGIPCLDLFHQSNLRPWDATVSLKYFSCGDSPSGDGLHPNSTGHKLFYRKILEFVKTLC